MKKRLKKIVLPLLLTTCIVHSALADGITIGGTRLIYNGGQKEASLNVTNSSTGVYLIQSWAETENGGAEKTPFIITPPLFRLDGNQQNLLRVVHSGGNLPEDRESLYWLNVKAILAASKSETQNSLQIAVKNRLKLIYRPQGLKGLPDDVSNQLTWSRSGNTITVKNPTPFYMNFQQVKVGGVDVKEATFVAPKSSATFNAAGTSGRVTWKVITDYGSAGVENTASL